MPTERSDPHSARDARTRRPGFPLRLVRNTRVPERQPRPPTPVEGRVGIDLRARASQSGVLPRARRDSRPNNTLLPTLSRWQPAPGATKRAGVDKRRRSVRGRIALAALLLVQGIFAGVIVWALTSPTWQVHYVRVEGTGDTTLISTIQALPLTGCNIFRCDSARQTRLISALPAVAQAQIHAAYPDELVVVVVPRHPALLWRTASGDYVIATDGMVLGTPTSDPAYAKLTVPDVSDGAAAAFGGRVPTAGQQLSVDLTNMAGQLRSNLSTTLGSGWALSYEGGTGYVATRGGGPRVIFGTPEDATQTARDLAPADAGTPGLADGTQVQVNELHDLLALLTRRGVQPTVIDLRWGGHPYYRT